MGRKSKQISTLHGYTLDELIDIKNNNSSKYVRSLLTTVIMRYQGYSPKDIMTMNKVTNATINTHIDKWNKLGSETLKDNRGGRESKFTTEMETDLIDTVLHSSPSDHGFVAHTWTCVLLSQYILNNYGESFSKSTIHDILKKNNLSYKRAQPKPTKAIQTEQERFKKNVRNTTYYRII